MNTMTVTTSRSVIRRATCALCKFEPSVVRSTLVDPLVSSETTFVCLDCYGVYSAAVAVLRARNTRLILTEFPS